MVDDPLTLLYRQIASMHWQDERVTSSAFKPGPNHRGLLSTRHERVGAERAYTEFRDAGCNTIGSWAVSANEVDGNGVCDGVHAYLDEFIDGAPDGHVSIDYNPSPTRADTLRIAKRLAEKATARGRQFPPTA
jgi:hypothetical protein